MASSLVHFPADFPKCPAASNQILRGNMTILCHNFGAVIKTGSANENKNANKFVQMSSGGASKSSLANSSLGEEKKMCRIFTEFQ